MRLQFEDFKITARFPTHWGDMDSAQHVNNLVYLRWAETARVLYFEAMGMNIEFSGAETGAILAWQDCKYIFPVTHPDEILVGVRCTEVRDDRFVLQTALFSVKHARIAAVTLQHIVPYSYAELRKVALPAAWVERIGVLET